MCDNDLDLKVKAAFRHTLDDVLLLKPESVTNPYKKSFNKDRTHNVSDLIESINRKIEDNVIEVSDSDVYSSEFTQLYFEFQGFDYEKKTYMYYL